MNFFSLKTERVRQFMQKKKENKKKTLFFHLYYMHRVTLKFLYGWLLTLNSVQLDSCSHQTAANSQQNLYTACTTCYVHQDFLKHFTFSLCACGKTDCWQRVLLSNRTPLLMQHCLSMFLTSLMCHYNQISIFLHPCCVKHKKLSYFCLSPVPHTSCCLDTVIQTWRVTINRHSVLKCFVWSLFHCFKGYTFPNEDWSSYQHGRSVKSN